jgi:hypothetical protein
MNAEEITKLMGERYWRSQAEIEGFRRAIVPGMFI